MTDTLSDLCATKEYTYQINCTNPDFYASEEAEKNMMNGYAFYKIAIMSLQAP